MAFVQLGEITSVLRGRRLTKNNLSENEKYPVFHGGLEPLGYYSNKNRNGNTVMIINVGASAGTVGFSSVDFWSSDGCFCLANTNLALPRYLYYGLLCNENKLRSKVRVAGIPTLDAGVIENITIPLPPLEKQKEIVEVLDKFDKIVNDLTSGLPAEIKARQEQYEYYRNKLLSFKELKES